MTTTRTRFVVRYHTDRAPILNDPRIDQALQYALRETVMTVVPAGDLGADGSVYRVELHRDPESPVPGTAAWTGSGKTMLEAVRSVLGDYFADWDLVNTAYEEHSVIDAYSYDDEVIRTRRA